MVKNSINIFISGDFAPRMRVEDIILQKKYHLLYNDILPIIQQADISVTNLEIPLIESGSPINKTGPNLKSSIKSIEALKFAGFELVTLANNHMMDYGTDGLQSTLDACKNNNIKFIGAGSNLKEAQTIQIIEKKGYKIGFINCCENEWSTTNGDKPGCNPVDEIYLYYQIQEAKLIADKIILIIHGGHETFEYPSPRMKKQYRWFIDLGVDAVIGHHTHCFSGFEVYKNRPIIYSLGNFIFDSNQRNTSWNIGAAVVLSIMDDKTSFTLYPFTQCNEKVGVNLLDPDKKREWMDKESIKTNIIQDNNLLICEFNKFISNKERLYRSYLEPNKCRLIIAAKNRGLLPRSIKGSKALLYLNIIRTEAHRDIILNLLEK